MIKLIGLTVIFIIALIMAIIYLYEFLIEKGAINVILNILGFVLLSVITMIIGGLIHSHWVTL